LRASSHASKYNQPEQLALATTQSPFASGLAGRDNG
jgi:hypothetical protein